MASKNAQITTQIIKSTILGIVIEPNLFLSTMRKSL